MKENMIDVEALAARLGVSRSLIYKMVEANEIPHYRIGAAIRFDPEDIEKWLGQSYSSEQAPRRCNLCN
jgi:excisionase family DNA binding protein